MFRKMRRIDKQMTQADTLTLLESGREGILGTFGEDGYPYTVVVNYVYYQGKVYFHSAKTGHKIDNINHHHKVSFTVYDNVQVIGDELTTFYRSLTLFGKAKIVDTTEEVLMALINKYADIEDNLAKKMIAKEIDVTALIEIDIDHITGKIGNK